jgi:N-acetylglucosaminyldiphosphoundecaprenol N-acetyl-beta-D-mannosaminyltransferase
MAQALSVMEAWIEARQHHYICVTPIHGIMECQNNPDLTPLFNASGLTVPDGMGVVWLLKLMGHTDVSRVYGPDLMQAVCAASAEKGWRHFLYGGAPGIAEQLAGKLQAQYPGLQIVGMYTPPFRALTAEEDEAVTRQIQESGADIVWVGVSTPKQELWMSAHCGRLNAPVLVGVGAAFDFLSGAKPQAPRWVQRGGLEWLFRLASEPRRLWRRYAQYPLFAWLLLGQALGLRRYPRV